MRGITTFELTNVKTGEVEVYEDHNMFTNALDSVFNRPPFYFNNTLLAKQNTAEQVAQILAPIYNGALGGLLLFPEPINEDSDNFFAPADNQPTGLASNDGYTGEDRRRGSFNSIDSGVIERDGKPVGYRYVWDFPTSAANGKISCACLTSVKGGAGYLDSGDVLLHKELYNTGNGSVGISRSNVNDVWTSDSDNNPRGFVFGGNDKGIYFSRINGQIGRNSIGISSLGLFNNPATYEYLFTKQNNGALAVVGDDVWTVRTNGNASGNATINIDKYIAANNWEMTTETITVNAQLKRTELNYTCAVIGNFLYMCGYGDNGVYKINLLNVADVTFIDISIPSSCLYSFGDLVSSQECFIDSADNVHMTGIKSAPCYRHGAWAVLSQANHGSIQCFFTASIFMPYLATINNISPVNKTPDKTMRVTYIVYED